MESTNELTEERATVYRVRIAHAHTLKDGWRVSETTVEASGVDIPYPELERHMRIAHDSGTVEAKRRNDLDRRITGIARTEGD